MLPKGQKMQESRTNPKIALISLLFAVAASIIVSLVVDSIMGDVDSEYKMAVALPISFLIGFKATKIVKKLSEES